MEAHTVLGDESTVLASTQVPQSCGQLEHVSPRSQRPLPQWRSSTDGSVYVLWDPSLLS
jgi:hypothetical protein